MNNLQESIEKSIDQLEKQQKLLEKIVSASKESSHISFETRFDGIEPNVRFRQNLQAFNEYFPDIYNELKEYSPDNFDAVITNDGLMSIVDLLKNKLIYTGDPKTESLTQYVLFRHAPGMSQYNITEGLENRFNFIHQEYLYKVMDAAYEIYGNFKEQQNVTESIKSMMIFGVGLGYHIEWLVRDCQVQRLFIIEPELDLLFTSLFCIDWSFIFNKIDEECGSLHFSVALTPEQHFKDFKTQLYIGGRHDAACTNYLVHHRKGQMSDVIKEVEKQYLSLLYGYGFFDDSLQSIAHQSLNLKRRIPYFPAKTDQVDETPVFLIGNGPSLDRTIDIVKTYKGKAIIVALGSAITSLHKYDIKPDLFVVMERTKPQKTMIERVGDDDYLRDIPCIALNTIHPEVFDLFDEGYIFCKTKEPGTSLFKKFGDVPKLEQLTFCNPTVSNTGLSVIAALGYRNIYLFGIDFGYPNGQHHSKKSFFFDEKGQDKKIYEINEKAQVERPGNFGDTVKTEQIFLQSSRVFECEIDNYPDIDVKNTSYGIEIRGAKPLIATEINIGTGHDPKASLRRKLEKAVVLPDSVVERMDQIVTGPHFDDLVDELIAIINKPAASRQELAERVDKQFKRINQLEYSADCWLADMLRGSLLYIHSATQKLIYLPKSELEAIEKYNKLSESIVEYLEACRRRYHTHLFTPDNSI